MPSATNTIDLTPYTTPEQIAAARKGEVCEHVAKTAAESVTGRASYYFASDCPRCHGQGRTHKLTFRVPLAEQPPSSFSYECCEEGMLVFAAQGTSSSGVEREFYIKIPLPLALGDYVLAEEWRTEEKRRLRFTTKDFQSKQHELQLGPFFKHPAATMPPELAPRCDVLRLISVRDVVEVECENCHGVGELSHPAAEFVCSACKRTGRIWHAEYGAELEVRK